MPTFRTKPVVKDAVQHDGTPESDQRIIDWTRGSKTPASMGLRWQQVQPGALFWHEVPCLSIATLEGSMWVDPGDWIVKGLAGEFYPCKPDIFAATYELVPDQS